MTKIQQIPAGYKQTDVGVIPEDWEVMPIVQMNFDISDGNYSSKYPKSSDFKSMGVPFIRANNIKRMTVIDDDMRFITKSQHTQLKKGHLKKNDVLITTRGEIGQIAFVPDEYVDANINAQIVRINTANSGISSQFFGYYLTQDSIQNSFENSQSGSALKQLPVGKLVRLLVVIPSKKEQEKISEALLSIDSLISKLDQLIQKKKNIKQGAMQELLTGRRRLPGFTKEWETYPLKKIAWFQEGPGVRNSQFTKKGVKLLNGTNIFRGKIDLDKTDRYISKSEAFGGYKHFLADDGDIVIASSGITIDKFDEKIAVVKKNHLPLCMNTSTIRFKVLRDIIPEYLFYSLMSDSFKGQIGGQATGSAQLNFGPAHLKKIELTIPNTKEQSAISQSLSDIDEEINFLESKRNKYQNLKQGMMQQLLTGKIRLI